MTSKANSGDAKTAQNTLKPKVFMMDLWATVPYYTAYLSAALFRAGVPVQIGSISYYLDPECFRSRNLQLRPGLLDLVGRFTKLPRALRRMLKLVEGLLNLLALAFRFSFRPPDIIHVQFLPMLRSSLPVDLWFVRFCQWRGMKAVLTVHDLMPHDTGSTHHALFQILYGKMDGLICHSDHIRSRLMREFDIPPEKITVIQHGPFFFDLPEEDPDPTLASLGVKQGEAVVLWQGIIFPYKGVDLLLDAWKHVEQEYPEAVLVVLGTGDPALTAQLETQARDLDLSRVRFNFRFCSPYDLVAAYRSATVVVYPYRAITTSGALATGLALYKPIVASDIPVFREALHNGSDALLVDAQDPQKLARSIVTLLQDRVLREQFRSALAAAQSGDDSWSYVASRTISFYEGILH